MRLIIAGSRAVFPSPRDIDAGFDDLVIVFGDVSEIVSGRASGADTAGEEWAKLRGIPVKEFPINEDDRMAMDGNVKLAPKMRNRRMAEYADAALVWWDGLSGGSCDLVTRMVARDKFVRVIPMKRRK